MAAERGGFDPDRIVSHGTERTPTSTALASVRGEMLPALAPHAALRLIRDWERDRTQSLNRLSSLIRQLNTASFAQSHLQMGAVQRRPASVGDEQLESRSLAGPVRQPDPSRHDDDVGVDRPEHIVKHLGCMLRRPLHSQCASVSSVITYPAIGRIRRSDSISYFKARNCCHCAASTNPRRSSKTRPRLQSAKRFCAPCAYMTPSPQSRRPGS